MNVRGGLDRISSVCFQVSL